MLFVVGGLVSVFFVSLIVDFLIVHMCLYLLGVVYCVLLFVCCLFVVCCWLYVACCVLRVAGCFWCGRCVAFCCLLFVVGYLFVCL